MARESFRDTFDFMDDAKRDRGRFGDNESVRSNADVRSDLIDVSLVLHHETPARGAHNQGAILVSNDGKESRAVWIPKSRCEFERKQSFVEGSRTDGSKLKLQCVTVTMSQGFAKEKGLV